MILYALYWIYWNNKINYRWNALCWLHHSCGKGAWKTISTCQVHLSGAGSGIQDSRSGFPTGQTCRTLVRAAPCLWTVAVWKDASATANVATLVSDVALLASVKAHAWTMNSNLMSSSSSFLPLHLLPLSSSCSSSFASSCSSLPPPPPVLHLLPLSPSSSSSFASSSTFPPPLPPPPSLLLLLRLHPSGIH